VSRDHPDCSLSHQFSDRPSSKRSIDLYQHTSACQN